MSHQHPKSQTLEQKKHADAYQTLIERLAAEQPDCDFTVFTDVGLPDDETVSATILAHPEVLGEIELSAPLLARLYIERRLFTDWEQVDHVKAQCLRGAALDCAISRTVTDQLLRDLRREVERREAWRATEANDARHAHGDRRSDREVAMDNAGVPQELRT